MHSALMCSLLLWQALISKRVANMGVLGQLDFDDLGLIPTALPATINEEQKALCTNEPSVR